MKKKILLVDDEEEIRELIKQRLLRYNYEVLTASNGREALVICGLQRPDLVLMDIVMPEMDGYLACEQLRMNKDTKDLPVIFLTGKDLQHQGIVERCKNLDVQGYISKINTPEELFNKIKEILGE
ncbi:MAG: response regulator [Candidatus Omnitrophota bacterium]